MYVILSRRDMSHMMYLITKRLLSLDSLMRDKKRRHFMLAFSFLVFIKK